MTQRLESNLLRLQAPGVGLVGAEVDARIGEIVLFYQGGAQEAIDPEAQLRAQDQARGLLQARLRAAGVPPHWVRARSLEPTQASAQLTAETELKHTTQYHGNERGS